MWLHILIAASIGCVIYPFSGVYSDVNHAIAQRRLSFMTPKGHKPFNYEFCAKLHNEIVRRGIVDHTDSNATIPTWWEAHASTREFDPRERFTPSMIEFYERALWPEHQFFFHLFNLAVPGSGLEGYDWPLLNQFPDHLEAGNINDEAPWLDISPDYRFMTLYNWGVVNVVSHHLEVVYDQLRDKACLIPSIWHDEIPKSGQLEWLPLEQLLQSWIDMLDEGKVRAVGEEEMKEIRSEDPPMHSINEYSVQWVMAGFTEKDLTESVRLWNALVHAIEGRMPDSPNKIDHPPRKTFIDNTTAHATPFTSFQQAFFQRAHLPHFSFIAPGLRIPTTTEGRRVVRYHRVRSSRSGEVLCTSFLS